MSDTWEGLLDRDEQIIWQGQPQDRLKLDFDPNLSPLMCMASVGFGSFFVYSTQGVIMFSLVGCWIIAFGLYDLVGVHFWKRWVRRCSTYTLTSKNAFVSERLPWQKFLKRYPISASTQIELVVDAFSDIWFAEEKRRFITTEATVRVGFEQLAKGRDVFAKFRQVQENAQ